MQRRHHRAVALVWLCLVVAATTAGVLAAARPASAESMVGPEFRLTGTLGAKNGGLLTLDVTSVEQIAVGVSPPATGSRLNIRIGFGTRFLQVGRSYTLDVFFYDDAYRTHIRNISHTDGTPIDTALLRRTEVRVTIAVTASAVVALIGYGAVRRRRPRLMYWS